MEDDSDFTNLLKRKVSKTYGCKSYPCNFLNLTSLSTDGGQIDNAILTTSSEQLSFFLEISNFPRIDEHTIQLNKIHFFYIKRLCFVFYMKLIIARSQVATILYSTFAYLGAWTWYALFHGWFRPSLAEFQMQILYGMANIIKHHMFIDLKEYIGLAIRKYLAESKVSGPYALYLNENFKSAVSELKKFLEFSLLNFQNSFFDCLGWYMEEFTDTSKFIHSGQPRDGAKKLSYKNGDEAQALGHIFDKITFPRLAHIYGNEIDKVVVNHQKNHGKFYLGVISIQNPTFTDEDKGICAEKGTNKKYNENNNAIDGIDIFPYSENIRQGQAERSLVNNIHPTTVFPLLKDDENEINHSFYDCRGRSYYRRFCRNYDEESDYDGDSRSCKYSSSSERLFALDEEHSMLCIPESKKKRKFSTELEILDFEFRKEAQLNHRSFMTLGSFEKKKDFLFQNDNFFLTDNLKRQELLESNSIGKPPNKKTLNSPIVERSSNGNILNSSTFGETKNSYSFGN